MGLQNKSVSPQYECAAKVEVQVPVDFTPSFRGSQVPASYTPLHLYVEQRGVLGGIYKKASNTCWDVPVIVGMLGYGFRFSDSLKNYTAWDNNSNRTTSSAATNDNDDVLRKRR